jgi:hypothetical protein
MPALFLAFVAFLVVLAVLAAWALLRGPVAWRRIVVARRVSISLKAGPSISGILIHQRGDLLVVAEARLLEEGSPPVPLDGEVVLERAAVSFVQLLAPRSEV